MSAWLRLIAYIGALQIVIATFAYFGWVGGMAVLGTALILIVIIEATI